MRNLSDTEKVQAAKIIGDDLLQITVKRGFILRMK